MCVYVCGVCVRVCARVRVRKVSLELSLASSLSLSISLCISMPSFPLSRAHALSVASLIFYAKPLLGLPRTRSLSRTYTYHSAAILASIPPLHKGHVIDWDMKCKASDEMWHVCPHASVATFTTCSIPSTSQV